MVEGRAGQVSVSILRACAVVLAVAAIVFGLEWSRAAGVLAAGAGIERTANEYVVGLNEKVESFKGDVSTAVSSTPVLSVSRQAFDGLRQQAADLPAPPGTFAYREALKRYLAEAGAYYGQLSDTSDFVIERTKAVSGVIDALQGLSDKDIKDEAELRKRASESASLAASARLQLAEIDASSSALYSSVALGEWLGELEESLTELDRGLGDRNLIVVTNSSKQLGALVKSDWDGMFFEADRGQVTRLEAQRQKVEDARAAVAMARDSATGPQQVYRLATILLAVCALVLAPVAWLR